MSNHGSPSGAPHPSQWDPAPGPQSQMDMSGSNTYIHNPYSMLQATFTMPSSEMAPPQVPSAPQSAMYDPSMMPPPQLASPPHMFYPQPMMMSDFNYGGRMPPAYPSGEEMTLLRRFSGSGHARFSHSISVDEEPTTPGMPPHQSTPPRSQRSTPRHGPPMQPQLEGSPMHRGSFRARPDRVPPPINLNASPMNSAVPGTFPSPMGLGFAMLPSPAGGASTQPHGMMRSPEHRRSLPSPQNLSQSQIPTPSGYSSSNHTASTHGGYTHSMPSPHAAPADRRSPKLGPAMVELVDPLLGQVAGLEASLNNTSLSSGLSMTLGGNGSPQALGGDTIEPLSSDDPESQSLLSKLRSEPTDIAIGFTVQRLSQEQIRRLVSFLGSHPNEMMELCLSERGNVMSQIMSTFGSEACTEFVAFITAHVSRLATHKSGCIALMRCYESMAMRQRGPLDTFLIQHFATLATDQFGNYVVQHVMHLGCAGLLQCASSHYRVPSFTISSCTDKFGGHTMEKFIEYAPAEHFVAFTHFMCGNVEVLRAMIHGEYGNYGLQKCLRRLVSEPGYPMQLISLCREVVSQNLVNAKHAVNIRKAMNLEPKTLSPPAPPAPLVGVPNEQLQPNEGSRRHVHRR